MRILGLAGRKGSGKDSSARFLLGEILKQANVIEKTDMDTSGNLLVNFAARNEDGKIEEGMGIFDVDRADPNFVSYLEARVWPHTKVYHFADTLKWIGINLYGLDYNQLYGTQAEKEAECDIVWKNMYNLLPKAIKPSKVDKDSKMTGREFIQHLGDVLRFLDDDCFTKSLLQRVMLEQCPFAIIADVRRIQEVEAIKACGGKVIYHARETDSTDGHSTEHEFDSVDKTTLFDYTLENKFCTIQEKNSLLLGKVREWGWL